MEAKTILIIGDPHAHPDYDNDRFEWLGNLILDRKPDIVLCTGDIADMASLSSYDKGTKGFEGRRYKKDVEATLDAQHRLWSPTIAWNNKQSKSKKAQYNPHKVITVGNHEGRISKAVNNQAELEGTISVDDLQLHCYWDQVISFKDHSLIQGFAVSHYFASGVMSRPIGGENQADMMLKKLSMSAIVGHSHLFDVKHRTRADGKKIMAISAGCYVNENMVEDWNAQSHAMWWSGVIILHEALDGYCQGFETITQTRIKSLYS